MLARVYVFHQDLAAGPANTRHFAQDLQRLLEMMHGQPAHNYIEYPIIERKILRIGRAESHIGDAALMSARFGNRQHGIRQVHADYFSSSASEGFRDIPRTCRNIKHALASSETRRGYQAPDAFFVGDPGIRRKSLGLCRERFSNDVVMLRHPKILAHGSL